MPISALQEFHILFQSDLTVHNYFSCLKQLGDLLCDGGCPMSDMSMVVNTLHGLSSNYFNAIPVITGHKPLPTFEYVYNYLMQINENCQEHTPKMEAQHRVARGCHLLDDTRAALANG